MFYVKACCSVNAQGGLLYFCNGAEIIEIGNTQSLPYKNFGNNSKEKILSWQLKRRKLPHSFLGRPSLEADDKFFQIKEKNYQSISQLQSYQQIQFVKRNSRIS